MGSVRSGCRARVAMNEERESEVRGGLGVERAAEMRFVASLRWFAAQRRGIMALIWFTSSAVRDAAAPLLFVAVVTNSLIGNGFEKKLRGGFRWRNRIFAANAFMSAISKLTVTVVLFLKRRSCILSGLLLNKSFGIFFVYFVSD